MKNFFNFKVKQGGVLGRNLKHQNKIRGIGLGIFALVAIMFSVSVISMGIDNISGKGLATSVTVIAPIVAVAWIKDDKFVKLDADAISKLTDEEMKLYAKALNEANQKREDEIAKRLGELDEKNEAHKKEIDDLKKELNGLDLATIKEMLLAVKAHGEELKLMREKGSISEGSFKSNLKAVWDANFDKLKAGNDKGESVRLAIKATQSYGDINSGLDFAQMRQGIVDIPVRMPKLRTLFRALPLSTEFLKYTEQNTVVRDAKNVAVCSAVATNTKETIIVRSIGVEVIKDMIDFCRTFINDYPFMQSRIELLLNTSIALKVDSQLLNGTGVSPQIFSINSTASEFSAANPVAVLTSMVPDASMIDLILGMQTQIEELGEQGAYAPDTVLVNKVDWFLRVQCRKDANNNYLDSRVTIVNGVPYVGGMRVVWLPTSLLPQNKLFVFDSTKGEIVDRQELIVEVSFENRDNWEKEIATLKGYERLNFLVANNNKNAFMKCSDVTVAIAAIKKP